MTTSRDAARVAAPAPPVPLRLPPVALVLLLLFALAALLVQLELTVRGPGRGLMSFDSAEYAVAGRELARTGRLATPFALPVMIRALGPAPFPLLVGHPLVPLADAVLFRLAGERPVVTLLPPAVAFLAIVWLTALIALSASGSVGVALAAGMAMALSPSALFFATDGVSELPFAAFWTLALLLLMRLPERPRPVALGIALGLAHLARPVVGPVLPVWLAGVWLLLPRPHRWRRLGLFLAAFVPFAVTLLAYKRLAAGSALADPGPFLLLTHLLPGLTPHQMPGMMDLPSPLGFLAAHPLALPHKVIVHGARMLAPALHLTSPAVTLLFILHVAAPSGRPGGRRFAGIVVALWAGLFLLAAATTPSARHLFPMHAVVLGLAVAEASLVCRARGLSPRLATVACLALALLVSGYPTLLGWRAAGPSPASDRVVFREAEWRTLGTRLSTSLPRDAVVTSDVGPWVAWYGDRTTVQLPNSPRDLPALARILPIHAVVLTNQWALSLVEQEAWRAIFEGTASLPGWARADTVATGRLRAVVLRPARALPR